jgi:phage terminase large subunit
MAKKPTSTTTVMQSITKLDQAPVGSIVIPYCFTPRSYQLSLFEADDTGKYNSFFLRWSRRAGKDKTCINFVVRKMLQRVGSYFYVFPQYSQARKVMWEGMDMDGFKFLNHVPEVYRISTNNNEMKITLFNGSILRMIGSDNIDTIMGTNPVGIVYSEFSLQDPRARDYMSPILAQNGGWELIQGTPRGKNHMYDVEQVLINNPRAFISVVQSLWEDLPNYYPILTKEQLQAEREKGITEELMEQEYGVSYQAGVEGAYYADQVIKARKESRIGKYPHDDHKYVDTFWDIGLNDDTVIWFKQVDGRANVFIDYYEQNNVDLATHVKMLRDKGYKYRTHFLPHDGAQRSKQTTKTYKQMLMELCNQANISNDVICAPKPESKQLAITQVRARFSSYYFNESLCTDGLTKLSLYHKKYDTHRRCFIDNPVHDWCSHAADAISTEALSADMQDGGYSVNETTDIKTYFDPLES